MLQLTTSKNTTNAIWLDQTDFPYSELALALTASYSGDKRDVFCTVTSKKPGAYGMWVLFDVVGGQLPGESGQYDADIYYATASVAATWGNYGVLWANANQTYANAESSNKIGGKLATERAFISGSDFDTIIKYEYQDEPDYSVYDG